MKYQDVKMYIWPYQVKRKMPLMAFVNGNEEKLLFRSIEAYHMCSFVLAKTVHPPLKKKLYFLIHCLMKFIIIQCHSAR